MPSLSFGTWASTLGPTWARGGDANYAGYGPLCQCELCAGYRNYLLTTIEPTEEATVPTVYTPTERTLDRWRMLGIPTTPEESAQQCEDAYRSTLTEQFRYHAREFIRANGYGPGGAQADGAQLPHVRTIAREFMAERSRRGRSSTNVTLIMYDRRNNPVRMLCSTNCVSASRSYDEFIYAATADYAGDVTAYQLGTYSHPQWRVVQRGSLLWRETAAQLHAQGVDCFHCQGPLDPSLPRLDYCDYCSARAILNDARACERCQRNMIALDELCTGCGDTAHDPQPWCSGVNAVRVDDSMLVLAGSITRAAGMDPQQTVIWSETELSQQRGQGDLLLGLDDEDHDYGCECPDCW